MKSPLVGDYMAGGSGRAEEALRDSEERLRLAHRAARAVTWERDLESRTLLWSDVALAREIVGADLPNPTPYDDWVALVDPRDRERYISQAKVTVETGAGRVEYRIDPQQIGGKLVWLEAVGQVVARDSSGQTTRILGMVMDVTARKRAEAASRENEDRLRLAQKAVRAVTWERDIDAEKFIWSDIVLARELFGSRLTNPTPFWDWVALIDPLDRERYLRQVTRTAETGSGRIEFRVAGHGGQMWVEIIGQVVARDATGRATRVLGIVMDVTARKRSEAALRESSERLRLAQRAARAVTWELDQDRRTILWSDIALARELVAAELDNPTSFDDWLQKIHPADRDAYVRDAAATLETGAGRVEFRVGPASPGPASWLEAVGQVVARDAAGRATRVIGITIDVTARKRAEAASRESEERFALAQSAAAIGTYDWSVQEGLIRWSSEMFRLHDIDPDTPGDRLYDAWLSRLHPDDRDRADRETRAFLERDGPLQIEFRIVTRDGSVRWIYGRGTMERDGDGRPVRMIGVNIDVTERRLAEEALRESEARLRRAQDAGGICDWDWTPSTGEVRWSDGMYRLYGRDPAIFDPAGRGSFAALHPDDRDWFRAELTEVSEGRQPRLDTEYRALWPDGTVRWLVARGELEPAAPGRPAKVVGVNFDVTDRRLAEEALRKSEARLRLGLDTARMALFEQDRDLRYEWIYRSVLGRRSEDVVGLSDFDLFELEEDAVAVTAVKRQVLESGQAGRAEVRIVIGGVPHFYELTVVPRRDARGTVIGIAGAAYEVTERKQSEERLELLMSEVDHRAKNALAVVQAIANLTRADSVEAFRAGLQGRIAALGRAHTLLAQSRWEGASLEQLLSDELIPYRTGGAARVHAKGPPVRLTPAAAQAIAMALHELATNAAKHGALSVPGGRVSVTWSTDPEPGSGLRLIWRERGGPPPDPSAAAAGSGFGMTVISRSVQGQADGKVELDFAPAGVICTFSIPGHHLLPPSPGPGAAGNREPLAEAPQGAKVPGLRQRILIVEDNVLVGLDIESVIVGLGYRSAGVVNSLAEALSLVRDGGFDAAVLDINLDGEMVFPVADTLRELGIPFLFVTGYEQERTLAARHPDAVALRKPISPADLERGLAGILGQG